MAKTEMVRTFVRGRLIVRDFPEKETARAMSQKVSMLMKASFKFQTGHDVAERPIA